MSPNTRTDWSPAQLPHILYYTHAVKQVDSLVACANSIHFILHYLGLQSHTEALVINPVFKHIHMLQLHNSNDNGLIIIHIDVPLSNRVTANAFVRLLSITSESEPPNSRSDSYHPINTETKRNSFQ